MTDHARYDAENRTLWNRLFEPPAMGKMAPLTRVIVYSMLTFWSLFVIFPIYWVLITSFKLPQHVSQGPVFLPFVDYEPSLHAWKELFTLEANCDLYSIIRQFGLLIHNSVAWFVGAVPMESRICKAYLAYTNSFTIGVVSTLLCMLVGSMAAYALARIQYKPKFGSVLMFVVVLLLAVTLIALGPYFFPALSAYKVFNWYMVMPVALALFVLLLRAIGKHFTARLGNGDILFWIISQRILPPVVVIIPIYMMYQSVGLVDTQIGLIMAYAVANLPIVVWLMHDFFAGLPIELEESAQLDGATRFGIFWDIVLPLTKPGFAATTLLVLILNWNEYLLAVFLSTSKSQTMPILVAAMNAGDRGILWWNMCVVILVMIAPVIIMALFLQRFIAKGVLLGAVKG
jgi:multiple sugar transport system permease protein